MFCKSINIEVLVVSDSGCLLVVLSEMIHWIYSQRWKTLLIFLIGQLCGSYN